MTENKPITTIKNLKIYLKYLLETEIRHRENSRGTGVFLAENIDRYYSQCAEIHLLQKILKRLGVKVEDYDPYETEEDDNKFNYCWAIDGIGVKNNDR